MPRRVLITGGAGFIGSHVADAFVARGDEVVILDDLSSGTADNVPTAARLVRMGINHPHLAPFVIELAPTLVCHLAAQISVRRSVTEPLFDAAVNVMGLLNLLQGVVAARTVTKVIFSSTGGAIYGDDALRPTPESANLAPRSPYGAAKAAAELYLECFGRTHGFATIALRYANVYGPRQDPHGEAGVVAIFAQKLLAGQACRINGTGQQTRDFVFVEDVARANLLAADGDASGAFNIGSGIETTITELHARMAKVTRGAPPPTFGPALLGEQIASSLDASRATRVLGWRPQVSLDTGLARTLEWFAARPGSQRA